MVDPYSFERLRPAGPLEQHATARHALDFYKNVAVSATYYTSSPSTSQALQGLIYKATAQVIAQNPSLSAIPLDEDKKAPFFVRLPSIDLSRTVTFLTRQRYWDDSDDGHDTELDKILEAQHNLSFKDHLGELPFWRLIILQRPDNSSSFVAVFVFHHAIADGGSGLAFHRTFLSALSEASPPLPLDGSKDGVETTLKSPDIRLLPNLEMLHPLKLTIPFLVRAQWNEWFPKTPAGLWTGEPVTDESSKRTTRITTILISREITTNLLLASRRNATTLTATIEEAFAVVLFANLSPEECSVLNADGPISLRRWLPSDIISDDSMGTFVSRYVHRHHRPRDLPMINTRSPGETGPRQDTSLLNYFSWDQARKVKETISSELAKDGTNIEIALLRWVGNFHDFFRKKVGRPRETSFEVSNLGVFKAKEKLAPGHNSDGGASPVWKVSKVVFSQSAGVAGAALSASLVTGMDGRLSIAVSWIEGIVEGSLVSGVLRDLQRLLGELAGSERENSK